MDGRVSYGKELAATSADDAERRVETVLAALSLLSCVDTRVGDALNRGVSGGERKRVSVAEARRAVLPQHTLSRDASFFQALVTNARVLCLDEISTGLDASVTYDIVAAIKARPPHSRESEFFSRTPARGGTLRRARRGCSTPPPSCRCCRRRPKRSRCSMM